MSHPPFPSWRPALLLFLAAMLWAVEPNGARAEDAKAPGQSQPALTERQKVVHALNRLGFGPRPGDVERVEKMGLDAYVRQQLHPETIDDSAAEKALEPYDTLTMSSKHLSEEFFANVRRFVDMQMAAGNGEEMKLRYGIDPAKLRAGGQTGPATKPAGRPSSNCRTSPTATPSA